jgi:hypothetical protein
MLLDLPESPRYLLAHGRIEEARVVIAHLTGKGYKPTDSVVLAQVRAQIPLYGRTYLYHQPSSTE